MEMSNKKLAVLTLAMEQQTGMSVQDSASVHNVYSETYNEEAVSADQYAVDCEITAILIAKGII